MADKFDPYYKWLGIPPRDQPPNHYRLLAIEVFETDPEVIDSASNRQMTYLQEFATGPNVAFSQKLLNEVAAARVCLLNAGSKSAYDEQLRAKLTRAQPSSKNGAGNSPPQNSDELRQQRESPAAPSTASNAATNCSASPNKPANAARTQPSARSAGKRSPPTNTVERRVSPKSKARHVEIPRHSRKRRSRRPTISPTILATGAFATLALLCVAGWLLFPTRAGDKKKRSETTVASLQTKPAPAKTSEFRKPKPAGTVSRPLAVKSSPPGVAQNLVAESMRPSSSALPNTGVATSAESPIEPLSLEILPATETATAKTSSTSPAAKLVSDLAPASATDVDRERAVAVTVLERGGTIVVRTSNGAGGEIRDLIRLPAGELIVEQINLAGNKLLDNADLSQLHDLPALTWLFINNTKITDVGLNILPGLTNLQVLYLGNTGISSAGVAHVAACRHLKALNLSHAAISDESLSSIGKLSELSVLVLNNTKITDVGLAQLQTLSCLSRLSLAATPISGSGLSQLRSLAGLCSISLANAAITDEGMTGLSELKALTILDLSNTPITDKGLAHLADLKNLSSLLVTDTKVTAQGVRQLHRSLPGCKIEK